MNGMKRLIAENKNHSSDALLMWLWDPGIIQNDKLFQEINKLINIQELDFDIEHKKGKMNFVADSTLEYQYLI